MTVEELKQALDKHASDEMARYDSLESKIDTITTNHLVHIQQTLTAIETKLTPIVSEFPVVATSTTELKERMRTVLWVAGIIGSTVIVGLVTALLSTILKR